MNLGHISFHFCPLCQNCYTIVFFIYVVRCDMPCTLIMLGFTLYNFDNKYPFIVIVIVIVISMFGSVLESCELTGVCLLLPWLIKWK